jgi:hypothetical protein
VRDELVLDRMKYGNLEGVRKLTQRHASYLVEQEELSFVWTDDWDGFFEHRRIVEYED